MTRSAKRLMTRDEVLQLLRQFEVAKGLNFVISDSKDYEKYLRKNPEELMLDEGEGIEDGIKRMCGSGSTITLGRRGNTGSNLVTFVFNERGELVGARSGGEDGLM